MKHLLLCDNGDLNAALIAKAYNVGVEFGSFYEPEPLENPEPVIRDHEAYRDLIYRALHGAFGDLCPGSFDPLVREVARKRVLQSLEVAERLDVHDVIFHHGYVPRTSSPEGWIRRAGAFWKDILAQTQKRTRIHLENMLEDTPEVIKGLVDAVNSPRLGICYDIGHAFANSKTSVLEWVEALGARISYVHIHDNDGTKDQHLAIGDGCIPIKSVLDAIEIRSKRALWALEISRARTRRQGLIRSLEWMKNTYSETR